MIGFRIHEVMEGTIQREGETFDRPFRIDVSVVFPSLLGIFRPVVGRAVGFVRIDGPRARRIALALARAVVPPGQVFAGADDATVERLEHLLTGFGPVALRGYAQLLRVLDVMSRGARGAAFTRLDRDEAEDLLVRWTD